MSLRYRTGVFCNNCGHRNPPESNFCSSCGSPFTPSSDTTISFLPEDSSGDLVDEEVSVPAGDLSEGTGVLVVKRGPDAGARFVLTGEVTRVGRHPDSEIFLDDVTVSRRHAEFRREAAALPRGGRRISERHLRQPGADRDRHLEGRRRGPDRQVQARFSLDGRRLRSQWGSAPIWQLATCSPCSAKNSPDITISKIRFLESRGLLVPERTPSGYRKFYEPDVERLRWILRQQREHFLPLKVIKGRLDHGMSDADAPAPHLFEMGEPPPERNSEAVLVGAAGTAEAARDNAQAALAALTPIAMVTSSSDGTPNRASTPVLASREAAPQAGHASQTSPRGPTEGGAPRARPSRSGRRSSEADTKATGTAGSSGGRRAEAPTARGRYGVARHRGRAWLSWRAG